MAIFFWSKCIFPFFCDRLRVFAKCDIFPTYGYAFFSTICWKNTGLLRVTASTRIKYKSKYAYGHFFGTLWGLPIINQKICQYGFQVINLENKNYFQRGFFHANIFLYFIFCLWFPLLHLLCFHSTCGFFLWRSTGCVLPRKFVVFRIVVFCF